MCSSKLMLVKTEWHKKVMLKICYENDVFNSVDINNGFIEVITKILEADKVYTFLDKSIFVIIANLLGKEVVLIEEGIGLYYEKRKIRRLIPLIRNFLLSLFSLAVNFKWNSFNYEQGHTKLYNKLYCRRKNAFKDLDKRIEIIQFDTFFDKKKLVPQQENICVFWGCDYLALQCVESEFKAIQQVMNKIGGELIYKPHPRLSSNLDSRLSQFIPESSISDYLNYKTHVTLASGSIAAELNDNHDIYLYLDESVEMSSTLKKFYGLEDSENDLYLVKNKDFIKLIDVI